MVRNHLSPHPSSASLELSSKHAALWNTYERKGDDDDKVASSVTHDFLTKCCFVSPVQPRRRRRRSHSPVLGGESHLFGGACREP